MEPFTIDGAKFSRLHKGSDGIWYSDGVEAISYPEEGNDNSYALEEKSYWFAHRNRCITSLVSKLVPPRDTVVDVGGGNGFVSLGLQKAGFNVVLIEPGVKGVRHAKTRGILNVICATTHSAGIARGSLPSVGLFDVLEHIEQDHEFLKHLRELLVPEGRLYITVPAHQSLWSSVDVMSGHYRRYGLRQLISLLESVGFKVDFASYIFVFLPLPIFLLRCLPEFFGQKRGIAQDRVEKEHATQGSMFMRLLQFFLGFEFGALERLRPLRFGASCILVARKSV